MSGPGQLGPVLQQEEYQAPAQSGVGQPLQVVQRRGGIEAVQRGGVHA